jgi:hypothetical protein
MVGSTFVRRLYWRAIWLLGIHSLGLWMLADGTARERRQGGLTKSVYGADGRD